MKFSCNQHILNKILNNVSKGVSDKSPTPTVRGYLIEVDESNTLKIKSTNLDMTIETTSDISCYRSGSTVVNASMLNDIVRKLPNEEVYFEMEEDNRCFIKTSSTEFVITGIDPYDFPSVGEVEKIVAQFKIDRETMASMIRRTSFCASVDQSKGVLSGVLFELTESRMNVVALDGFRMAVSRYSVSSESNVDIVISAKLLNEVYKILKENDEDENIEVILGDKLLVLLIGRTKIVMRLLEGKYIKYQDVIPKDAEVEMVVNRRLLQEAVERASLIRTGNKNNVIKCEVSGSVMTIKSSSDEGSAKEDIIIDKEGNDVTIGFNSKYVLDALRAIGDDEIKILMNDSVSPALIRGLEGEEYEYLLLPVRLGNYR